MLMLSIIKLLSLALAPLRDMISLRIKGSSSSLAPEITIQQTSTLRRMGKSGLLAVRTKDLYLTEERVSLAQALMSRSQKKS